MDKSLKTTFFAALFAVIALQGARAEDGVSGAAVKIGSSSALSGASAGLGTEVKAGTELYFKKLNAAGGVNGRKIEYVALDDAYEPENAVKNTQKLIEEEKVFALTGYVGTPTGKAAVPVLSAKGVPLVGMFTGAEGFRNPVNHNIFHIRASYFAETEEIVNHLVKDLKIKDIGIFIQDDAYGAAGEAGVQRALVKAGLALKGKGTYKRNTTEVDAGLDELVKAGPKAVVMVGSYKACAAFMKKAHAKNFTPVFVNISFVGTENLIQEAGDDAEGSYITQVVPYTLHDLAITKKYVADAKAAGQKPSFGGFEGYLNAMVLAEGLKRAGKDLTRAGFRSALEQLKGFDLGGVKVSYGPTDHEGLKSVFLTKVTKGKPVPVTRMD